MKSPGAIPAPLHLKSACKAADVVVNDMLEVQPHEEVLITADFRTDPAVFHALLDAVTLRGARGAVMLIPQLPCQGKLADPYIGRSIHSAVKSCDVWIDLTFPYLGGSEAHSNAMKEERVRCFLGADLSLAGFERMFAGVDIEALFQFQDAFDRIILEARGKRCRITNDRGTDIAFNLAETVTRKPRKTNMPGTFTPPGSVVIYPEMETVKGVVVFDAVLHEYQTLLADPITVEVDSVIKTVSGGRSERFALERALRRAAGAGLGQIIHFSYGFHPAARFTGQSFIEDVRVVGNNAVGLGVPWWLPGGGENHPDGFMTMQTLEIDGRVHVKDGLVVYPEPLVEMQHALGVG
ncbi:MAG: hypothetical protein PHS60_14490 [Zavarzinia sp.]|nr:hypothetical protein [Zavarzinia sp.]